MAFTMPKNTNPFLTGALAGAVLAVWVGFDAMGWKTASATEALVKRGSETAVTAAYAHVCANQFNASKDHDAKLVDLKKVDQWSRGDALAKTGFATMTGDKEPAQGVGQACAQLLVPEKS
ncbi:MAG: hypothetical protein ABI630_10540 [Betaproteobacteria bacterium]